MKRKRNNHHRPLHFSLVLIVMTVLSACQTTTSPTEEIISTTEEPIRIEEEVWDLLWISDSSGWGVAKIYGQFIAEDNGVEVNVIDDWIGGLSAGTILQGLTEKNTHNGKLDNLEDAISKAEVIVIYGNPEESENPDNPGDWNCGQNEAAECYVTNCEMATFANYIADLEEIYSLIFQLREGKPTIVRAIDAYNPNLPTQCGAEEILDICTACWETYNMAIHQAAEAMGVPVANVFDAWNGINHDEDPVAKGNTRDDNTHPNETGATVIAETLRALGYEPMIP